MRAGVFWPRREIEKKMCSPGHESGGARGVSLRMKTLIVSLSLLAGAAAPALAREVSPRDHLEHTLDRLDVVEDTEMERHLVALEAMERARLEESLCHQGLDRRAADAERARLAYKQRVRRQQDIARLETRQYVRDARDYARLDARLDGRGREVARIEPRDDTRPRRADWRR